MLYNIKRGILLHIKSLEYHFEALHKRRQISKAYQQKNKKVVSVTIDRRFLLWISAAVVVIIVFSIIISNIPRIIDSIQNVQKSIDTHLQQNSQEKEYIKKAVSKNSVQEKKPQPPAPTVHPTTITQAVNHNSVNQDTSLGLSSPEQIPPSLADLHIYILANKATKTLYLFRKKQGEWITEQKFFMAIGEKEGRKEQAWDKKTPEGLYFIVGYKQRSELTSIYGPLAYVLNYPNEEDRKQRRTGEGIWIHGTHPDSLPVQTQGCLELKNSNILILHKYLKSGIGTPVQIINRQALSEPSHELNIELVQKKRQQIILSYAQKKKHFTTWLNHWKQAWESQNIAKYTEFYDTSRFIGQGLRWHAWRDKKLRTFENYRKIEITLDKVFLSDFSENTAVLKFIQEYESDLLHSVNGKKIDLIKAANTWKIFQENTFPDEELVL